MMAWDGITSGPTAKVTATGSAFEAVNVRWTTDDVLRLYAPTTATRGAEVVVVIACHGAGGSHNTFESDTSPQTAVRDACLDRGWVVAVPNMHGNTWGNDVALADLAAADNYVRTRWQVAHVLALGLSMGGGAVANMIAQDIIPPVAGAALIAPAINLAWMHDNTGHYATLRPAYGAASDGSNFATASAGHDTVRDHAPADYAGHRMKVWTSPTDTVTPKQHMVDRFVSAGLHSQMAAFESVQVSGGHLAAGNYKPSEVVAWFEAALDPPVAPVDPATRFGAATARVLGASGWQDAPVRTLTGEGWQPTTLKVGL